MSHPRALPGVVVAVGRRRDVVGRAVEARFGKRVHVLDDGFQHLRLARDLDIVCVGEGDLGDACLPAGRLRERPDALARADVVLVTQGEEPAGFPATATFRATRGSSGRGSWLRRGPRLEAAVRLLPRRVALGLGGLLGRRRRRPAPRGHRRRQPLRCACAATRPRAARAGPPPRRVPGGALDAANPRRPLVVVVVAKARAAPAGRRPTGRKSWASSGRGSRGDVEVGSPGRRPTWAVGPRPPRRAPPAISSSS